MLSYAFLDGNRIYPNDDTSNIIHCSLAEKTNYQFKYFRATEVNKLKCKIN